VGPISLGSLPERRVHAHLGILYSRCNFSGGARGVIHCFDMKYPQEEKRSWDAVVTRISLSLRPLES
jgi:hypothetical protein